MRDPYQVLGVGRNASADEIKRAYRALAKRLHPDLNPGDSKVEQQFKEVSQAYSVLGDPEKRKRFDRGEIDASGQDTGWGDRGFYRTYAESGEGAKYGRSGFESAAEDIFADLFGHGFGQGAGGAGGAARARAGGHRRTVRRRGADVTYEVEISFTDAALGARRRMTLTDGKTLEVAIPPGTEEGQTLRLKGKGMGGMGGAPDGDAFLQVQIQPHRLFTRKGSDIHLELPITLQEAIAGATIEVPTLYGVVSMKVPAGANSGQVLRLKGKGVLDRKSGDQGDQYVTLKVMLPDKIDDELRGFI
ncbi:MAG: DnaJ C-terminal domain-containing protein, partial [Kiloniellales bacterium]